MQATQFAFIHHDLVKYRNGKHKLLFHKYTVHAVQFSGSISSDTGDNVEGMRAFVQISLTSMD